MTRASAREFGSRALALLSAMAMVAAVLVSSVAFAAPASAHPCTGTTGYVCLYKNSSYASGGVSYFTGGISDYGSTNYTAHCSFNCKLNDSISSIQNRGSSWNTRHYEHAAWSGSSLNVLNGGQLDLYGIGLNDDLSSHKWYL